MLVSAPATPLVRDYTPADRVGAVQGLRMVFFVLMPMGVGPSLGTAVIRGADTYYEDLGRLKQVPTPGIFLAAAAVGLLAVSGAGAASAGARRSRREAVTASAPVAAGAANALGRGSSTPTTCCRSTRAAAGPRQPT